MSAILGPLALIVPLGLGALLTAAFGLAARAQDDVASFELTLEISWSAATAPYEFPADAHLSGLVGATHDERYRLFRDGDTASSGLELVAENGRVAVLRAELAEAIRRRWVGTVVEGPDLPVAPGAFGTRFETTSAHPLLSFVTMLAPSPDWFTGAADVRLRADDAWLDEVEVVLWAWDAGTDHGTTYTAADADGQPQQSVRLLATPHLLTPDGLVALGTARIRRLH